MGKQIHLRAVSASKVIGNTSSIKGERAHQDVTHDFSLAVFDMSEHGGGSFEIKVGQDVLTVTVANKDQEPSKKIGT